MTHNLKRRPLFSHVQTKKPQKMRWRVLPLLWAALKRTCMVLGALMLFSAVFGAYMASKFAPDAPPSLPPEMMLYVDLRGGVVERRDFAGFGGPITPQPHELRHLVKAIDRAAQDPRVKGLYTRFGAAPLGSAHVQELRSAMQRFRSAGKFSYAFATSYNDLGHYYLASAHDEIWVQPVGVVSMGGFSAEIPFFRGALEKLGILPQFFKRKDYKTAYESLTNSEMSEENRAMLRVLLDDMSGQIMSDLAGDGRIATGDMQAVIDKGLHTDEEAIKAQLITRIGYYSAMMVDMWERVTGDRESRDPPFIRIEKYAARGDHNLMPKRLAGLHKNKGVALVYMLGPIMNDGGSNVVAADKLVPVLEDLKDDKDIKVIIVRIDSPGGSPEASESILHALKLAQEKDKTVIVSMGPVAASGGYWVASHADQIFVQPTTITGSIGVVGGKFAAQELSGKWGINWDRSLRWGENAGMMSLVTPFSESEAERMNAMLDRVYQAFAERVSNGRNMSAEDVEAIAQGRVWSGKRAVEIGLADQIGGLREVLDYAAQTLELSSWEDLDVFVYPRAKTPFEQVLELLEMQASLAPFLQKISAFFQGFDGVFYPLNAVKNTPQIHAYETFRIEN